MDVLVPVKVTAKAKGRLGTVLDASSRVLLVCWMLERVLRVASRAATSGLIVIGGDSETAPIAHRYSARPAEDAGGGLNPALAAVLREVRRPGLTACMVLAADLPWLTTEDVNALVSASGHGRRAVIAPARDGMGTNAVVVPEGYPFRPLFGPSSRALHNRQMSRPGSPALEVSRPGLALDVDLPEHLAELLAADRQRAVDRLPPSIRRQVRGSLTKQRRA